MELGIGQRGHLARDRLLVVGGVVEGQREGADRLGAVPGRQAKHGAGVEPSAQVASHRDIGPKAQLDRIVQCRSEHLRPLADPSARPAALEATG